MSDEERKPMANIAPFGLRMQPDLKSEVEMSARMNERSMNAEIVNRLVEYRRLPMLEAAYSRAHDKMQEAIGEADLLRDQARKAETALAKAQGQVESLKADNRRLQDELRNRQKELFQATRELGELRNSKDVVESAYELHQFRDKLVRAVKQNPFYDLPEHYIAAIDEAAKDLKAKARFVAVNLIVESWLKERGYLRDKQR